MAEFNQFGSVRPSQSADTQHCSKFDVMLADAVDGSLSAEEQAAFDLHLVGCPGCSEMLAGAKRGAAWLEMLRQQAPQPPAALLDRILAQTSGAKAASQAGTALSSAAGLATGDTAVVATETSAGSNVLPFRRRMLQRFNFRGAAHTLLQPRLAMTAAMAFFSIALTLNLTGVRISDLRASDLKPSSLKRSLYEANAHVVRYYTNLRVVYELESRVHDLQRSSDEDTTGTRQPAQPVNDGAGNAEPKRTEPAGGKSGQDKESQPKRRGSPGTSRRETIPDGRPAPGMLADAGSRPLPRHPGASAHLIFPIDFEMQERGTV